MVNKNALLLPVERWIEEAFLRVFGRILVWSEFELSYTHLGNSFINCNFKPKPGGRYLGEATIQIRKARITDFLPNVIFHQDGLPSSTEQVLTFFKDCHGIQLLKEDLLHRDGRLVTYQPTDSTIELEISSTSLKWQGGDRIRLHIPK